MGAIRRFIRCLKIAFICNLFISLNCFAQDTLSTQRKDDIIKSYSSFINSLHLQNLVHVQNIAFNDNFIPIQTRPTLILKNVTVLTLAPDSNINTPFKFAQSWNKTVSGYAPAGNIYHILFTKLAGCTLVAPENLVINLKIKGSPTVEFSVYYNKTIEVYEHTIGSRDPVDYFDPGDLDDPSAGGIFTRVNKANAQPDKLLNKIQALFYNYKHKEKLGIDFKRWADGSYNFKVSNIEGQIIPHLHEIVSLSIFITPDKDPNYANVSYMFTVLCAGGAFFAPKSESDYKNALPAYEAEVTKYGRDLKQQIRQILNAR